MDSTLLKGLVIFERVVEAGEPVGVSALAKEIGLSRSNVQRTLSALRKAGYLLFEEDGRRYYPSLRALQVGRRIWATFPFDVAVGPALKKISSETGESAHLALLDNPNVIFAANFIPRTTVASFLGNNASVAWQKTAFGLVSVAVLSEAEQNRHLAAADLHDGIAADLDMYRDQGCCVISNNEERQIFEIAIPLLNRWNDVFGAIGISGPAARFSDEKVEKYISAIRSAWSDNVLGI